MTRKKAEILAFDVIVPAVCPFVVGLAVVSLQCEEFGSHPGPTEVLQFELGLSSFRHPLPECELSPRVW